MRRGLGALAATLVTLSAGCSWITGVPDVDEVRVTVNPSHVLTGATAAAIGTALNNGKPVTSSKVVIGYASSDPSVATVNQVSGVITAIKPGFSVITASTRRKSGTDTVWVTEGPPANITISQINPTVGTTTPLTIVLRDIAGQVLAPRKANITSSNPNVLAVTGDGTTGGTSVRGVSVGNATITVDVSGTIQSIGVIVSPPLPARATLNLPRATNSLIVNESTQAVLALFAADNSSISLIGQTFTFTSDDPTIATVNQNGVVQCVRPGTTTIRALVGNVVPATMSLTCVQIPTREVQIQNRQQFIRIDNNGQGVQSVRVAVALDSARNVIPGRTITYRSTDASVFTVTSLGTVVAQKLGTAKLIASADAGAVADTLTLTVTPVPVVVVTVQPTQTQVTVGQIQQFTATLTDSLGATVTGRTINWFSSTPTVMQIDQATGLGTAVGSGTAQIQPQVAVVPGFPGVVGTIQGGAVLVLPTPVASITVTPSPVTVQVGRQTPISVVLKDANGNTIFTARQINTLVADPNIATVQTSNGTGSGLVTGLKAGSTTITFQALDTAGNPQGAPLVVTVNVQ